MRGVEAGEEKPGCIREERKTGLYRRGDLRDILLVSLKKNEYADSICPFQRMCYCC
jgi:hypothetical protein